MTSAEKLPSQPKPMQVLNRVICYIENPVFLAQLTSLVKTHEGMLEKAAQQAAFISSVRADPTGAAAKSLRAVSRAKTWGATQFVPGEYEGLERLGLVGCEYGSRDSQGLGTRTIYLTERGRDLVTELEAYMAVER